MKLNYLFCTMIIMCAWACGSSGDDDGGGGEEPGKPGEKGLVLSVDQDSIAQITGEAVFTVKFDGKDITSQSSIVDKATGLPLDGYRFSVRKPGTYTFYAAALGRLTNEVNVVVIPKLIRMFEKNVLFQPATSITCSQCPTNHRAMEKLIARYPDRSNVIAFHGLFLPTPPDPYATDYIKTFQDMLGMSGTYGPIVMNTLGFVDVNDPFSGEKRYLEPGNFGLAITTSLNGDNATVTVSVKAMIESKQAYRLAVALVEDGLIYRQNDNGRYIEDYKHDNVLRYYFTDVWGDKLAAGSVTKDKEVTKTYTYNNIPAGFIKGNLKVVAYLMEDKFPDSFGTMNSRGVKLGSSVDYKYVDYFEQ